MCCSYAVTIVNINLVKYIWGKNHPMWAVLCFLLQPRGSCAVSCLFLGLCSSGQRSKMLLAGAALSVWGSLSPSSPITTVAFTFHICPLSARGILRASRVPSPWRRCRLGLLLLSLLLFFCLLTTTVSGWLTITLLSVWVMKSHGTSARLLLPIPFCALLCVEPCAYSSQLLWRLTGASMLCRGRLLASSWME